MEKTSDAIIKELFNSLEQKVSDVPNSDVISTHTMAESIKKHKRHDKSKKHKKHKKKSKKSKKKKRHTRTNSPDDYIELKLKKNKLEEAKSGMSVSLDVIMETIVSTANEKSEAVKNIKHDVNENCHLHTTLTDVNKVQTPENDSNQSKLNTIGLNNGKIIIKDLKKSRLYHELVHEVQEKERLKTEKCKNSDQSSSSHDLDKKKKKEKHKSKKKKRSRSRNRSSTPKRLKKYSRSRSNSSKDRFSRRDAFKSHQTNLRNQSDSHSKCRNDDSDIKSKEKGNNHKRSMTPDKNLKLIRQSRSRDSKKPKRSEDYNRTRKQSRSRETSKSKHRSPSCEKIDKKKLFKIARKNALSLVQQGVLPVGSVKKDNLANVPTKTVDELTDFCRKLSKKDKDHDDDSSYSSSDDEFKQPFHHPFLVKERPNIVMNIRNATQLPIKSFQEKTIGQDILRQQFPVSSGQTHSLALTEWMPIGPEESAKLNKILKPDEGNKLPNKSHHSHQAPKVVAVEPIIQPVVSSPNNAIIPMDYQYMSPAVETPAITSYTHGNYSLLSFETGQFTGHTGAKVLTPAELSAGFQTWVKKAVLLVFNIFKRYINNTTIERRFVC